jgi:hypothetical protein
MYSRIILHRHVGIGILKLTDSTDIITVMLPVDIKTLILEFADDIVLSQMKKRVQLNFVIARVQTGVRWLASLTIPPQYVSDSYDFTKGIRLIQYIEKRVENETLSNFDKMKLPNFPQKR